MCSPKESLYQQTTSQMILSSQKLSIVIANILTPLLINLRQQSDEEIKIKGIFQNWMLEEGSSNSL